MVGRTDRTDEQGRAYAGSQLQVQLYINRRTSELDDAIREAVPELRGTSLTWTSPRESDAFKEYRDGAFLEKVELGHLREQLAGFWPKNGPVWDALAVANSSLSSPHRTVFLVEGKSYPGEMRTTWDACDDSQKMIRRAMDSVCSSLGIERTPAWTDGYYQLANRIAHLVFLREFCNVDAWLLLANFVDDSRMPTSRSEWGSAMEAAMAELGLSEPLRHMIELYLPAGTRPELLADQGEDDPPAV